DVRDALAAFARSKGVEIRFDTKVTDLLSGAAGFTVVTSEGAVTCDRVIVATGGLLVPTTGRDRIGPGIAAPRGPTLVAAYPALLRQGGLQESRGHRRRCGAVRGRSKNAREQTGRGVVSLWRNARRLRADRRPQLFLGLGHRPRRGSRSQQNVRMNDGMNARM